MAHERQYLLENFIKSCCSHPTFEFVNRHIVSWNRIINKLTHLLPAKNDSKEEKQFLEMRKEHYYLLEVSCFIRN